MKKILVVEDDPSLRQNVITLLESENFETLQASNGKKAVKILSEIKPDLILSDIVMPEMNGYELLEFVQSSNTFNNTPFIFLTSLWDMNDRRLGMNMGADDYLTKPFKSDDLILAIKARLRKRDNCLFEKEELKKYILFNISHELRTPLVPILGYSDLILKDKENLEADTVLQFVRSIKNAGEKLYRQVEKYITYSSLAVFSNTNQAAIKYSTQVFKLTQADVKCYLKKLCESVEREMDLILNIEESFLKIEENLFMQMLAEIVENAFKFSEKGTQVNINGFLQNSIYHLVIDDKGSGMTKEEIENIPSSHQFDKTNFKHTGLGLAMVKSILKLINGKMEIKSEAGKYTSVELLLTT